jgi:hypothetical protein
MRDDRIDAELVDALEELLLQLERAIDARVPAARRDRLEADRLFVFAGQIDAALQAASNHLRRVRGELEEIAHDAT